MTVTPVSECEVLRFWFEETPPQFWFQKSDEFDLAVRDRFLSTVLAALRGETFPWRKSPEGKLAEVIVLDQFPRNIFRGKPESFAGDALALKLAKEAVNAGDDQKLPVSKRAFLYMPYMHSELPDVHVKALQLFSQAGLEENYRFEVLHKNIIDRFGRYPHRNQILGRPSTPEEIEFLKSPGSSF